jgi:glycine cleavage system transcriptional repressor
MAEEAVLVATGADRPGIMDELSQFLLESGGNVIASHSVVLRGQFALLLLVRGETAAMDMVRMGLPGLAASTHITLALQPASEVGHGEAATFPYIFTATGKDQVGVLHRISHLLRVMKVNIDNIQTRVSDDMAFQIRLDLSVPRETPVTMLRDYLTYLCNELGISGHLTEA